MWPSLLPIGLYPGVFAQSISFVNMKVTPVVPCPLLTSLASLIRSLAELIEYVLPTTKDVVELIAIALLAVVLVITLKNDVATDLVVTPTPIWVRKPPVVASSA